MKNGPDHSQRLSVPLPSGLNTLTSKPLSRSGPSSHPHLVLVCSPLTGLGWDVEGGPLSEGRSSGSQGVRLREMLGARGHHAQAGSTGPAPQPCPVVYLALCEYLVGEKGPPVCGTGGCPGQHCR